MRRLLLWSWLLSAGYLMGYREGQDEAARAIMQGLRRGFSATAVPPPAETLFHGD